MATGCEWTPWHQGAQATHTLCFHDAGLADSWPYCASTGQEKCLSEPSCLTAIDARRVAQNGETLKLPEMCPPVAARIFFECTKLDPAARCSALDIVHWLREG